jgi:four helix bundle protein
MYIKSYKDLEVWKKAVSLIKEIYFVTDNFPKSEVYCLVSQMRRAGIAIPSNIAEGYKRGTKEYLHFLSIAEGSAAELETQITLAKEIYSNIDFQKAGTLLLEVQKMLFAMIRNLKSSPKR